MRHLFTTAVLVISTSAHASLVHCQSSRARDLAGIGPIKVLVANLDSVALAAGLTQQELQTRTELELRKARIPVATVSPTSLHVRPTVMSVGTPKRLGFSYQIDISVSEMVVPLRKVVAALKPPAGTSRTNSTEQLYKLLEEQTSAVVWSSGYVGVLPDDGETGKEITAHLVKLLESFMSDYLSVNAR